MYISESKAKLQGYLIRCFSDFIVLPPQLIMRLKCSSKVNCRCIVCCLLSLLSLTFRNKKSEVSIPTRNVQMQLLGFSSVSKRHMSQGSNGRVMTTAQDAKWCLWSAWHLLESYPMATPLWLQLEHSMHWLSLENRPELDFCNSNTECGRKKKERLWHLSIM